VIRSASQWHGQDFFEGRKHARHKHRSFGHFFAATNARRATGQNSRQTLHGAILTTKRTRSSSRPCAGTHAVLQASLTRHVLLFPQAIMTPSRGPGPQADRRARAAPTRAYQSLLVLASVLGMARGFVFAPAAGGDLRRAGCSSRTGQTTKSVRREPPFVDAMLMLMLVRFLSNWDDLRPHALIKQGRMVARGMRLNRQQPVRRHRHPLEA